jgi:uncharacterized membrane protein
MNQAKNLRLVVATFPDETGAARALATMVPGVGPERIGQAAIVSKEYEGKIRFHETPHTSVAEGAAEGAGIGLCVGLLGILFTPLGLLGLPIGAAVGALVVKLRDTDFEDDDLKAMGRDLDAGHSALVATIDLDDIETAERLLRESGAVNMSVKEVDAPLVAALDAHAGTVRSGAAPTE